MTVEILTQQLKNKSQTSFHQLPLTPSTCVFVKFGRKDTMLTETSSHMRKKSQSQKMAKSVEMDPKCLL